MKHWRGSFDDFNKYKHELLQDNYQLFDIDCDGSPFSIARPEVGVAVRLTWVIVIVEEL